MRQGNSEKLEKKVQIWVPPPRVKIHSQRCCQGPVLVSSHQVILCNKQPQNSASHSSSIYFPLPLCIHGRGSAALAWVPAVHRVRPLPHVSPSRPPSEEAALVRAACSYGRGQKPSGEGENFQCLFRPPLETSALSIRSAF